MIITFLQRLLAILLGLATFFALVVAGEFGTYMNQGLHLGKMSDPAAVNEFMKTISLSALVAVVIVWAMGTFAGAWVATSLAPGRSMAFGFGIGVVVLVGTIANLLSFPHPAWMWVVGIAEAHPAAYLGACLARGRLVPRAVVSPP